MPSHTVAYVREGGIVESIYIHEGSLKDVGNYLLEHVKQVDVPEFMAKGDRAEIHDDADNEMGESELSKSLKQLLESAGTDYIYVMNRLGYWEIATGESKTLTNLGHVITRLSREDEFTCDIDREALKAEIVAELMEILPEAILEQFDERLYQVFGIKPPTRH